MIGWMPPSHYPLLPQDEADLFTKPLELPGLVVWSIVATYGCLIAGIVIANFF